MLNIDDRLIKEVSPKIKPNALSVLLAIAIHLNQRTNRCFPSHARLMQLTGLGRDAVYGALDTLKENNLLRVTQPVNSKTRKFGRREFRVSTKFISIFVAAQDAGPLPENPYTADPYTADPYTENQETYQINEGEPINKNEQIKKVEQTAAAEKNPVPVEAEKEKSPPPISPPPPPPSFGQVDAAAEIERLRTDQMARETFTRNRRIPQELYEQYLGEFATEVSAMQEPHYGVASFRRHFFNWAEKHYRIAKDRAASAQSTTTQQRPGVRAGT